MEYYFDFWTAEENKLVKEKRFFAIVVNFEENNVSNYIYEYDYLFTKSLLLSLSTRHTFNPTHPRTDPPDQTDSRPGILFPICVNKQFIVLKYANNEIQEIGECDTEQETNTVIAKNRLDLLNSPETDDTSESSVSYAEAPNYVVVNLACTKPYFFKLQPSQAPKEKPGTFFDENTHEI